MYKDNMIQEKVIHQPSQSGWKTTFQTETAYTTTIYSTHITLAPELSPLFAYGVVENSCCRVWPRRRVFALPSRKNGTPKC